MKKGRYYLGRVIKTGTLDHEKLIQAIKRPTDAEIGGFRWTFIDTEDSLGTKNDFIFSRLAKYHREGHVPVVDTDTNSQKDSITRNQLMASAPFVYLPEFSGIAYLHVWDGVRESTFRGNFKQLIEEAHEKLFVECEVEPIADYQKFITRIKGLKKFTELNAKIHPPNPLFGDIWKHLHNYIKDRKADEIRITEKSEEGLISNLKSLIDSINEDKIKSIDKPPSITDAAILMAADGYGSGKVSGLTDDEETIVIRTSDVQKSFLLEKEPDPLELYQKARKLLQSISSERDMDHD